MTPEHRAKAEQEAADDLAKSARHLLFDIHDELIRTDRTAGENLVHAQKRLASLTVKNAEEAKIIAEETKELTRKLHALTLALFFLTFILFIVAVIQLYKILN